MTATRRERFEELEDRALAPYGMRSRDSRGREHPEDEPINRSVFQRDRDRVLHTTAFRRLEYKTQVFVNHEGDYYRTRLTHTLEVAQIGRTLARALGGNEDLTEAVCLVHDIGHPPFGHSGEMVLADLMKDHGGFDHNRQALRIVTHLERRYPDFNGLNLTYEVREGIVKHETEYDVSSAEGYEPDKRGNLAAQIANVADELAYTAHDLDDGLYARMITPAQLDGLALWDMVKKSIEWDGVDFDEMIRHRLVRRLIGIEVRDVVTTTLKKLEEAKLDSVEALQKLPHNIVTHSDELAAMNRELKDFLYANLYRHYRVVRMATKADRFIRQMYDAFVSEPDQLPKSTQERLKTGDNSLERVVCDYLAGMTDRFALQEHERLFATFASP
jgi:dGTPase